jgi:hypothetical protein
MQLKVLWRCRRGYGVRRTAPRENIPGLQVSILVWLSSEPHRGEPAQNLHNPLAERLGGCPVEHPELPRR